MTSTMNRLGLWTALVCGLAACGDENGRNEGIGDHSFKAVVSSMLLGTPPGEYASDIDGDGDKDDGLGRLSGTLSTASGLDLQAGIDDAIASGETLLLIEVQSHDESFESDESAVLTIYRAETQATPNLTGGGSFTIDTSTPPFVLEGELTNHVFRSNDPSGAPVPLEFAFAFGGEGIIEVPIIAVNLTVTIDTNGNRLTAGKLAGAVLADELESAVMPVLAAQYNAAILADPTDSSTLLILNLFDTGGCNGGVADNSVIELCEVENNTLLDSVFAPDVDIVDASGEIAPKANGPKDALSLGVGFSGSAASF